MVAMALVLVPALWFYQTDIQLFGSNEALLTQRFVVRTTMILVAAWGIWQMPRVDNRASYARIVLLLACTLATCLFTLNAMRPAGASLPLRTPLQNLMVMYGAMPNHRWWQVAPPLAFTAGLIVLRTTWLTGSAIGDLRGDLLVIVVVNAVGILMVWRRIDIEGSERSALEQAVTARDTAERALGELRSLQGIIPICSYCHKVRTEDGDWEGLMRYVRERTDAEFSHGICPPCLAEHFPEYAGEPPAAGT